NCPIPRRARAKASARLMVALACGALAACAAKPSAGTIPPIASPQNGAAVARAIQAPTTSKAEVIGRFPHDPAAFTQGLIVDGDTLFESTGQYGESEVRRVDLATGRILVRRALPDDQFGEGLARVGGELVSLTWLNGIAHRWDAATLSPLGSWRFDGEGWGLASDGAQLYMSDGTATIRVIDPANFAVRRTIAVTQDGFPVRRLNELEIIDGRIWANIWMRPIIVIIDPASGRVVHRIDCSVLVTEMALSDGDSVLNGIAFDNESRRLFVTGKNWPTLFELRLPTID
nr:glutaminyl-peptide cyclotransferase [Sphingopyxis sp.]